MSRRKGDSYLGGHTIWPSFGPSPLENDLTEKKRRKEKRLNRARKARQSLKKLQTTSIKKPRKIQSSGADERTPSEIHMEALKEIGFGSRLGKIFIANLAESIRQAYRAGFKSTSEICTYLNANVFYTTSGSKWSPNLVEIARQELRRRNLWTELKDTKFRKVAQPQRLIKISRNAKTKLTGRILKSQSNGL